MTAKCGRRKIGNFVQALNEMMTVENNQNNYHASSITENTGATQQNFFTEQTQLYDDIVTDGGNEIREIATIGQQITD